MVAIHHTVWFLKFVYRFNMVVFRQKNIKKTCFCFRTWFVLFWFLCFEFCFSVQVCWFLTSRWLFLNNKGNRKEHVFVLEHGLFCYDFCCFNSSFLVSHLKMVVFKQKISDKSIFLFSNMVCFVLIIVFWILFFNSSLLVSHFKMVVFKQQKYQTRACFCFRTWFVLFWLLRFEFKFVGFSPAKGCF